MDTSLTGASSCRQKWRWTRRNGVVIGNMLLLLIFFGLDVRDLYFKLAWLGPFDAYAFTAIGHIYMDDTSLQPSFQKLTHGETLSRSSGWSSFLQQCEEVQGSGFFLDVLGKNCTVGDPRRPHTVKHLLMSSAIRVDSVAWASCQLLRLDRRPTVCQERMVTGFLRRYKMEYITIPAREVVRVNSPGERELLGLLGVISRSSPQSRTVCVQAFEFQGEGEYRPTIFGCGNPNAFESAFAGFSAPYLQNLLLDKAWLTCDVLSIMRLQFVIRQNNFSIFTMYATKDGVVTGEHKTIINFSASGQLYALVIMIDMFLTGLNAASAVEIVKDVLIPAFSGGSFGQVRGDTSCFSIFSRSLYRCRQVVLLTTITHLISWQVILPNAVVWTWTSSRKGKLVASMSSIRVWVLLLISLNTIWDAIVFACERWAYAFARRTYLTTAELMSVGAIVAFVNRADLFSMGEKKYALERQRLIDANSFQAGNIGFSNAYNDDKDGTGILYGQHSTDWDILRVVYEPLMRILIRSIMAIFGFLIVKMSYLACRRNQQWQQQISDQLVSNPIANRYKRLPTEILLGIPIRARSIIRSGYDLEVVKSGSIYVPASLVFDFGILVDQTTESVYSRVGFFGDVVPPSINSGEYSMTETACDSTAPDTSSTKSGPTLSFTLNPLAYMKSKSNRRIHV